MIDLSLAPPRIHAAWGVALDLAERLDRGWTLIGAQMVALHGMQHQRLPPRSSEDVDVLVDVRLVTRGTIVSRPRQAGNTADVTRLQIEDVEEFRSRIEKIQRGDELKYRIRCRWKCEEEDGRPGPHDFDIDDGVKVNIRPFQEAGLMAVREVIKKW